MLTFKNPEDKTSCIVLNLLKTENQRSGAAREERVTVVETFRTMQLVLSSGFLNVSIFPLTLPFFIGYPLTLVSRTNFRPSVRSRR